MEQNKREQFIIRRIGGTTYKVRVVFNENGGETMEDKILRIVRNDMVTSEGTCGIMETPQMSRQSERSASCETTQGAGCPHCRADRRFGGTAFGKGTSFAKI